ncbi:hypothetical protein P2318_16325 [Myxococcaceae bacterium GXIMD 01537]
MKPFPTLRSPRLVIASLALALLAGCGEDEPVDPEKPNENTQPAYAFVTQVSAETESHSYIVVTDSLDHTQQLSLTTATEVKGRALISGQPKTGTFFVTGSDSATVTRYKLNNENRLEETGTLSFASKGVKSIGEYQNQLQYISETKAYYFDGAGAQIIVWNPKEMVITTTIPLPEIAIENAVTTFATLPLNRTGQVLLPVGWRPSGSVVGIVKKAGIVAVDTATDKATVVTDDRCGYVRDGVIGADGAVYLATEAYGAAVFRVKGGDTPVPCLLKFNPQTLKFDPDFYRELSQITGQATTGSLLAGPNGTAFLRVLDESVFTVQPNAHPRPVASAAAWTWWQLNFSNFSATKVAAIPPTTGSAFVFEAGNRLLFTEFTNASTETNLRELTDQSGKLTANTKGLTFSFLQLR